jgi:hypothetical protein
MAAAVLTACGGGGGNDTPSASALGATVPSTAATLPDTSTAATTSPVADTATATPVADASTAVAEPAPTNQVADLGAEIAPLDEATEHSLASSSLFDGSRPPVLTGTGTATVSWEAPATQANGDMVGLLAGYRIYFGNTSGQYSYSVFVPGGTAAGGTVAGLTTGTWYFTVSAVDARGYESSLGYEMSKTL